MGYFQSGFERVTLEFRGPTVGTFLRLFVQWIFSQLVLPTAWGTAILYRWLVGCVRFSDGTTATFVGRPVQVWGWIALSVAMYHVPNLVVCVISSSNPFACMLDPQVRQEALADGGPSARNFNVTTGLAILPIVIYVELVVYRWIVAGVRLRDGPLLQFTGSYLPLLGWTVLIVVFVITIIGWAWASTAFFRWLARNVEGDAVGFEFEGSGWGFLWRMLVVIGPPSACISILAFNGITWAWSWVAITPWFLLTWILVISWYVSNTVMIKVTTSNRRGPNRHVTNPEGYNSTSSTQVTTPDEPQLHPQYASHHPRGPHLHPQNARHHPQRTQLHPRQIRPRTCPSRSLLSASTANTQRDHAVRGAGVQTRPIQYA